MRKTRRRIAALEALVAGDLELLEYRLVVRTVGPDGALPPIFSATLRQAAQIARFSDGGGAIVDALSSLPPPDSHRYLLDVRIEAP